MIIRQATVDDVEHMQTWIGHFAREGLMLPRSEKSLYETLHCFVVAEVDGAFAGTAGLHMLWRDLSEIRSLAVHPDMQGNGVGRNLVKALIARAESLHVSQVLSLTYQTAFFSKLGFEVVQMETLPHKIWADCMRCPKFHNCDEVAMLYSTKVAGAGDANGDANGGADAAAGAATDGATTATAVATTAPTELLHVTK